LAKLRERGVRKLRFGLTSPRRENHTPVGRRKQIALATPIPDQRLHLSSLYQERKKKASRKKNLNFVQHALRNPFVKGRNDKRDRNDFSKRLLKQGQNTRRKSQHEQFKH
jgi:hypothetical protein